MNTEQFIIQTTATGRTIRQAINALLKAHSITTAYKIPYVKHFTLDDNKKTITTNIQLLVLQTGPKREQSGPKILDQILKLRAFSELKL